MRISDWSSDVCSSDLLPSLATTGENSALPEKPSLDAIDRRILSVLQENARISNVDLAGAVGVSPSPCWRRVRELEQVGVIARYVTLLEPASVGLPEIGRAHV